MPVAGDAAFGEGDEIHILFGRLCDEMFDLFEVGLFAAVGMFELNGCDAYVFHIMVPQFDSPSARFIAIPTNSECGEYMLDDIIWRGAGDSKQKKRGE
jgi:hypothetical protein